MKLWLAPLVASALAAAPLLAQAGPPPGVPVLHPGDMVKVTVWRNPEMSGDFLIGPTGSIEQPLYQTIHVAGIPIPAVVDSLRTFLTHYEQNPQLVVQPLFRVTVGGDVRVPNLYSLPIETTISEAVAQAGGAAADGNLSKVHIIRGGQKLTADLTQPNGQWANATIHSGDEILVSRKSSFFRNVFIPLASLAGTAASIITLARTRH